MPLTKNKTEWRVSAFDLKTSCKSFQKRKRKKCKANALDKEIENYFPLNEITNQNDNKKNSNQALTSPVLNKRPKLNDELPSPVIVRNIKHVIKNRKTKLASKNKEQYVRKLIEPDDAEESRKEQFEEILEIEDTGSTAVTHNNEEDFNNCLQEDRLNLSPDILSQNSSICGPPYSPPKEILEDSPVHSLNINGFPITLQIEKPDDIDDDFTEPLVGKIEYSFHPTPPLVEDIDMLDISPSKSPVLKGPNEFNHFVEEIDNLNSPSQEDSERIEAVSSQDNSTVVINSNSTVSDSLEDVKVNPIMEISNKKHKKKYKAGTHAHNLQKLLTQQKNDISIWKHEHYLKSTSNFQPAFDTNQSIITLTIKNICDTFGTMLIMCSEFPLNNECFLIPTVDLIQDLKLEKGDHIEIYPSYFIKNVNIFENNLKIFINVNKIIKLT